jgi:hypothetical protein
MRMHEKILTLLYTELLNEKTKKEVNVGRQTKQYLPPFLGLKAVGAAVAKLFQFPDGATQVVHGCVRSFTVDDDGGLYSIRYDDGDTEDMDCEEFCAGHELATTLNSTSDDVIGDKTAAFQKALSSPLENLTDMIRHLGELGPTWTHQWSDTNTKALKNIKLPLDQSKKIFKDSQLAKLFAAVDVAVDETKPDLRSDWKLFLTHYIKAIEI